MAARKPIRPASIQPHQPANQVQRDSAVGTHPTVVPNLLKPWRKNVLQESRYELVPANAPRFRLMGSRRCVTINHSLRVTVLDPLVANRHAIDVRSQVLQSCRSIAYRLDIDDPFRFPRFFRHFIVQAELPEPVRELGFEDSNQSSMMHQEVLRGRNPAFAIIRDAAASDDVMNMRMVNQRIPSPSVKHAEESQFCVLQ